MLPLLTANLTKVTNERKLKCPLEKETLEGGRERPASD